MNGPLHTKLLRAAACALAAALTAAAGATTARADDTAGCPNSVENPYAVTLLALTGPAGADLTLTTTVDAASKCALPTTLKKVQLKVFAADGTLASTKNLLDVAAPNGVANVTLGDVPRDRRVEADVLIQTGTPEKTFVVRKQATTLLRPDLVVRSITAQAKVLTGRPFPATVVVEELNKDIGATATVTVGGVTRPVEVAAGSTATVAFDALTLPTRGHVDLQAKVDGAAPAETNAANNTASTPVDVLLPPDLVVRSITLRDDHATPPRPLRSALAKAPFTIVVEVEETNDDTAATATVTMSAVPGASKSIAVAAGRVTTVEFPDVAFEAPVPVAVTAQVLDAAPAEDATSNNAKTRTVEITKNELPIEPVILFPSLLGYGAQFNHHLYAPINADPIPPNPQPRIPPDAYPDLEQKVKQLEPQLVRIFYSDNWEENIDGKHPEWRDNYDAFVKSVELARDAGAIVDISYQNLANLTNAPDKQPIRNAAVAMRAFADALEDLVRNHGLTNVRWATIGNEPNGGGLLTMERWEELYRALHGELVARGLDDEISLMLGGFIESSGSVHQNLWLPIAAERFGDIIDAYAIHVYWWYDIPGRLEYRLRDTYNLVQNVLPESLRKPVYMMEFGARGYDSCGSAPYIKNLHRYYRPENCVEIWRTNIAAFQQLWFAIDSAQLGVGGASKWDAFWAIYDNSSPNNQSYWMIGPAAEGYPLWPTYHALSLLYHVTAPGWQILQVEPWADDDWLVPNGPDGKPIWNKVGGNVSADTPEQELVAYAGPNGEYTVMGLDTNGRALNGVSTDPPSAYSIGGLPENTTFKLAVWNANGDGTNSVAETIDTGDAGVARFEVPLHAAFALTNVPVS